MHAYYGGFYKKGILAQIRLTHTGFGFAQDPKT